jgi:hypothetical protein
MKLEYLIFPYWLVFAALIVAAVYIRKFKIIPTLKKYDRDYKDYISLKKQRIQLNEYIELCKEHGLPNLYWKYMKVADKAGILLVLGWFVLLYMTGQS